MPGVNTKKCSTHMYSLQYLQSYFLGFPHKAGKETGQKGCQGIKIPKH